MKKYFLSVLLLSGSYCLPAQDINYAKKVIDALTSRSMHGRGYVNGGNKIASRYIAGEFEKLGLRSFNGDYYQRFTIPVNTFPGAMKVKVDKNLLNPGTDYLVSPFSGACKGTFVLYRFEELVLKTEEEIMHFLKKADKNKFILINLAEMKKGEELELFEMVVRLFDAKGIVVVVNDKLTWHMAPFALDFPVIEILDKHISDKARKITVEIENTYLGADTTQNVVGYVEGEVADKFVVFTAHYDHLGMMGQKVYFPGANDNASGTAMLLDLAKHYAKAENKPGYSVVFIAFGAEEVNLLGSKYFTEHPLFSLRKIRFLINLDLLGTGDEGATVVNGSVFTKEFDMLVKINEQNDYLVKINKRGKAMNSDHYYFGEWGVKTFFIYTLGERKHYHDVYDKADNLPLTEYESVFRLLRDFIATFFPIVPLPVNSGTLPERKILPGSDSGGSSNDSLQE